MAAPQTHFVVTFVFRAILSFVFGITFTITELFLIYFWGFGIDLIDHFTSLSYTRDVFLVRLPRFFKGGAVGKPSKGVKIPTGWLHIWPGAILSVFCGLILFPLSLFWIPFFFLLSHYFVDEGQENDGGWPEVPFFYPFKKKEWRKKRGYPVKSRIEILISTFLSLVMIFIEIYLNFLR